MDFTSLPYFDVIRQQPTVNCFRSMSHKHSASKRSFLQKPRQSTSVIQMKTAQYWGSIRWFTTNRQALVKCLT